MVKMCHRKSGNENFRYCVVANSATNSKFVNVEECLFDFPSEFGVLVL
jgi:hypothetical protein